VDAATGASRTMMGSGSGLTRMRGSVQHRGGTWLQRMYREWFLSLARVVNRTEQARLPEKQLTPLLNGLVRVTFLNRPASDRLKADLTLRYLLR
jgi:hypothetical protein